MKKPACIRLQNSDIEGPLQLTLEKFMKIQIYIFNIKVDNLT